MGKCANDKNGKAAAAVLSASIGSLFLGVFAFLAEVNKAIRGLFAFYPPSGPLSGLSTLAILIWLVTWTVLHFMWRNSRINFKMVFIMGMAFIGLGLILVFPPLAAVLK